MRSKTTRSVASTVCGLVIAMAGSTLPATRVHASSPFDGRDMKVSWEYWSGQSPGAGGTFVASTDAAMVRASDAVSPDLPDFHSSTGNTFELWDVDFDASEIRLVYTSIYVQDHDHQYMYLSPVGFHLEDVNGVLGPIEGVAVDATFAPFGFDPSLVTFDDDHIWVDLQGSMCHYGSMGSMPSCNNPGSPTGYDNEIVLSVTVPEPGGVAAWAAGLGGRAALARRRRSMPALIGG